MTIMSYRQLALHWSNQDGPLGGPELPATFAALIISSSLLSEHKIPTILKLLQEEGLKASLVRIAKFD